MAVVIFIVHETMFPLMFITNIYSRDTNNTFEIIIKKNKTKIGKQNLILKTKTWEKNENPILALSMGLASQFI